MVAVDASAFESDAEVGALGVFLARILRRALVLVAALVSTQRKSFLALALESKALVHTVRAILIFIKHTKNNRAQFDFFEKTRVLLNRAYLKIS